MIVPDRMPPKFKHFNVRPLDWLQGVPNPEWIMAKAQTKKVVEPNINPMVYGREFVKRKQLFNGLLSAACAIGAMGFLISASTHLSAVNLGEACSLGSLSWKKWLDFAIGEKVIGELPRYLY